MISQFMGSSPVSGSVLTARSLEPASDSVSPSLSAPPLLAHSLTHNRNPCRKEGKGPGKREAGAVTVRREGWVTVTEAEVGGTHCEDAGKAVSQGGRVAARTWKRQEDVWSP